MTKLNQQKIEKLLKGIRKKDPLFKVMFDCNHRPHSNLTYDEAKNDRFNLLSKHSEFKSFGIKYNCKIRLNSYNVLTFYNNDVIFYGYFDKGKIVVERKK